MKAKEPPRESDPRRIVLYLLLAAPFACAVYSLIMSVAWRMP